MSSEQVVIAEVAKLSLTPSDVLVIKMNCNRQQQESLCQSLKTAGLPCKAMILPLESELEIVSPDPNIVTAQTHGRCAVFDANGLEWKAMRWVNRETGEGEQCVLDENGRKQVNVAAREIVTQRVRLATPILLVPIKEAG